MSKWLEQFNENYYGRSEQAKELEQFLKKNYQGSSYIPWATMERMAYQQDPDAHFEVVIKGNEFGDAGILWTDTTDIKTLQKTADKEIETLSQSITHFIVLELRFLGKLFQEVYPIQDNKYGAPKVIDQNMVNKAIQRGKAKIVSRATGLGLTLYETGDLQFEDDNAPVAVAVPAVSTKAEPVAVAVPAVSTKPTVKQSPELVAIVGEIQGNEAFDIGLQKIMNAVVKKYGFTISRSDADLADKLSKIDNLPVFFRTLKVQSGLPV